MPHRLKLFGGISIECDGAPLTGRAVQRRRLALMALLASTRSRGMSRERLISYLWPEASEENGRRFLSDSVYRINQALGGDVIVAAGDELRLDPERLPTDLGAFEDALADGALETAVRLYAGPFMDGFYLSEAPELERWIQSECERRAHEYAAALDGLAEGAERDGNLAAAVGWWRRRAAIDPYSCRVALRLMRALEAAGDRAAAIQHARIHETLLREELEIVPSADVTKFAEQLRRGEVRRSVTEAPGAAPSHAVAAPPRGITPASVDAPARDSTPASAAAPPRDATLTSVAAPPPDLSPASIAAVPGPVMLEAPPSAALVVPRRRLRWLALVGAGTAMIVMPVAGIRILSRGGANTTAGAVVSPRTIAVLPFTNLSGDPADQYFVDGVTEELIGTLGRVGGLRVASRTSSFVYKDRSLDVRDVGKRLGVENVVEGSIRRSGRNLRISVQLVSVSDGYEVWSESYEHVLSDVLVVQQDIARTIASKLRGSMAGLGREPARAPALPDAEAYDLYLRGQFAWHKRTRDGLREATEYFERATQRAPSYARAYAGLADAHAVNAFYDYERPRDAYPKAEAAARRAIELDPTLAAPHATLGYVLTYYQLDWEEAEEEFNQAIAADPGYSAAHQWYGNLLTVAGRFDEAERAFREAQETDPLSLIATAALGWSFYFAGKEEDALAQSRRALALGPEFELAHLWGGMALDELGRRREALEWIERAVVLSKGSALTRLAYARTLAASGSPPARDSARVIVREIEARRAGGEYLPAYEIAKVHLALGDRARALAWLRTAVEDRSHARAYMAVDPQLAPLRGNPEFQELLAMRRG